MANPIQSISGVGTTTIGLNPCDIIDNHAEYLSDSLTNVQITSNGVMTLTKTDTTTFTNTIPYFPDFVISGLIFTLGNTSGTYNQLTYTSGTYQLNAQVVTVASGATITLANGDVTFPRIDVVYGDASGVITYLQGTPAANPVAPSIPANTLKLVEIGVAAGASSTIDGYTITLVNTFSSSSLSNGTVDNQTLRWDFATQKWTASSFLKNTGTTLNINSSTLGANATVGLNGTLQIDNVSAPGVTTNLLYAVSGNIFWNGVQLNSGTLPTGTTDESVLIWDTTTSAWVENINFRTHSGVSNFGAGTNYSFATGTLNTFFGRGTLTAVTSGSNNDVFGNGAGASITTGSNNTLIGGSAGGGITTGASNTGIGVGALNALTTGVGNIAIGIATGSNLTTSSANILIGIAAGLPLTTGNSNIIIGSLGLAPSTSTANILFGTNVTSTGSNRAILGSNTSPISSLYLGSNDTTSVSRTVTVEVSPRSGTDVAGGDIYIRPQFSTGTGRSGLIAFQTSDASGISGTTPNTAATKLIIEEDQVSILAGRIEKFTGAQISGFTTSVYEYIYLLDSSGGVFTVTLDDTVRPGTVWLFKDATGSCTANKVTLNPTGATTIDGSATFDMDSDWMGVKVMFTGSEFLIIL